jgi:PAS domain S-box-containing protein
MKKFQPIESPSPPSQNTQTEAQNLISHQALERQVTALEKQLTAVTDELKTLTAQNQVLHAEKAQQNQNLKEIEKNHQLLILASASIIWAADNQGAFKTTVGAWERFTGQTYEQYKDLGWLDAIHPDDLDTFMTGWQEAKQTKNLHQSVLRLYSQQHQGYRHVIMRAAPLINARDEISQWLGSAFDITELKEQEDNLRADIERLNQTLKSAQIGTWYWDIAQDIMTWNGHIHLVFGQEPGKLKGSYQEFLKRVHEVNREQVNQSIQHSLTSEDGFKDEFRIVWPDGSIHFIALRGETYSDAQGGRIAMSGICWDITELKLHEEMRTEALMKAQENLKVQAEEAKRNRKNLEEFINLVCHEIRNPLNGIMGSIEWLKDAQRILEAEQNLISTPKDLLDKVNSTRNILSEVISTNEACAAHQMTVVNDVLDLSKLEANKLTLDEVVFAPNKVVESVAKMYKVSLAAKQLTFNVQLPEVNPIVKGDTARFKTITINLLTNALKFTEQGGITLRLDYSTRQANETNFTLTVQDTGRGMTVEEQAQLFERFKQGSRSVYDSFSGSGLGLLICKQLAELMKGNIQVDSELGRGTTFTVTGTFKSVTKEEREAFERQVLDHVEATSQSSELTQAKRILIVEDNVINQKVLASLLRQKGYEYVIANNGQEALEQIKKSPFDLIFMDITMPKMNGLEATAHIRQQEQSAFHMPTPIIAISGHAQAQDVTQALNAGMNDYITKPFKKDTIYNKIAQWTTRQISAQSLEAEEATTKPALPPSPR